MVTTDATVTGEQPPRRCGRCRRELSRDRTLEFQEEWALCVGCEAVLLPRRWVNGATREQPDGVR